jgi:hypothetical protein
MPDWWHQRSPLLIVFLHGSNAATDLPEFALNVSQAALAAAEEETNVVRAQLAASDAKVAGELFNMISYQTALLCQSFLDDLALLAVVLTEQPEALQSAVNDASDALHARGNKLVARL